MGVAAERYQTSTAAVARGDDVHCNVVLVGDARVGKTSLVNRVVSDKFCENYSKTPATSEYRTSCTFFVAGRKVRYSIMDLNGSPQITKATTGRTNAFREADVFLLCYKISDPSTLFLALNHWFREIRAISPETPIILVGCQSDHRQDRDILTNLAREGLAPISSDQALTISQQYGCTLYVETNAKSSSRSALSAFEVAALVILGKLDVSGSPSVGLHHLPPPIQPKSIKICPPVPPKPRRSVSQMTLNKENLYTPEPRPLAVPNRLNHRHQASALLPTSPKLSFKTSRKWSSTSFLSLSGHQRTPNVPRRSQKQQLSERTVMIKCQRLTVDLKYEEVEVEVPKPIYETLRLYNERDRIGSEASANDITKGCNGNQDRWKKSLTAKIKSLFANKA